MGISFARISPRYLRLFAVVAGIAAPFLWLFHPYSMFNGDMENLCWMTAYEAASLKTNWTDSLVFQTMRQAGIPFPPFYAWGYLVFNGVAVLFLGAAITLRLMMLGALTIQFLSTMRLGRRLGIGWWTSYVLSCVLGWAIYSLTNLYTRSDLMEFFSVCLLTAALCCLLTMIVEGPTIDNRYEQIAWGFYFLLVSMSHAITMVYGGVMLAVCGLLGLIFQPSREMLLRNMLGTFMAWTVTLLPWLYLMILFFGRVTISRWFSMAGYYSWTYLDGNSWNNARNCLWPFARAVWPSGVRQSGFDTQIATALLIVLAGYGIVRLCLRRQLALRGNGGLLSCLAVTGLIEAAVCFLAATVHETYPWAVYAFFLMQFPYRSVTYVNLGLFLAVAALLARTEMVGRGARWTMRAALALALLYAGAGLVTKLDDALQTRIFEDKEAYSWVTMHNVNVSLGIDTFGGSADYDVLLDVPQITLDAIPHVIVRFLPSPPPRFSELEPLEIDLTQPSFVATNVMCFPWNKFYANGAEVTPDRLGYTTQAVDSMASWGFWLGPGHYRLTCVFVPDRFYVFLRYVSLAAFLVWLPVFALAATRLLRKPLSPGTRDGGDGRPPPA